MSDFVKRIEKQLEHRDAKIRSMKEAIDTTFTDLMKNPDIKAQLAQELNAIKAAGKFQGPRTFPEGVDPYFEADSEIQPLPDYSELDD